MARKKVKMVEVPQDDVVVVEDTQDEATSQPEIPELESFLKEYAGNDFTVKVYKLSKDNTTWEICKKYPLDQFDADLIAEEFGGGKYKIKVLAPDGTFRKQTMLTYANKVVKDETPTNPNAPYIIQPQQDNASKELIQYLRDEINAKNQLMLEIMRGNKSSHNEVNILEQIKLVKSLIGENNTTASLEQLLKVFDMGMTMGSKVAEVESEQSPADSFIKKLGEALVPMLANMKQIPDTPSTTPRVAIEGVKVVETKPSQTEVKNEIKENNSEHKPEEKKMLIYKNDAERFVLVSLEQNKDTFLEHAKIKTPCDIVADYIASELDEKDLADVSIYLKNDRDRIYKVFPELTEYKVWVDSVFDEIIKIYEDMLKEKSKNEDTNNDTTTVSDR